MFTSLVLFFQYLHCPWSGPDSHFTAVSNSRDVQILRIEIQQLENPEVAKDIELKFTKIQNSNKYNSKMTKVCQDEL